MKIIKINWIKTNNPNYTLRVLNYLEPYIIYISAQNKYKFQLMDINDLAQELRLETWKRLSRYNPRKSSLRTWINKILKDKIKNLIRDNWRHKRVIQYYLSDLKDVMGDIGSDGKTII